MPATGAASRPSPSVVGRFGPDAPSAAPRPGASDVLVVVALLVSFVLNALIVARSDTPTVDEFVYLPAGYYHLRTGDLTFDSSNPPLLKMVMALPLLGMDLQLDRDPRWRDNR